MQRIHVSNTDIMHFADIYTTIMSTASDSIKNQRLTGVSATKDNMSIDILKNLTSAERMIIEDPGDARYFGITVGFLVFFLGTMGNGLTVWAYMRNKNLQTSFNVLIANLCLIELMFSFIVIPIIMPGYIVAHNVYPESFCLIIGYFYYTSLASSLYNLVAIAINRYVGIVKPERYQKLFSGPRLTLCIVSVWLVPHLLYLPIVIGKSIYWQASVLRCSIGASESVSKAIRYYNLGLNIIFQAIPLIILIVLYTAIFRKVKQVKEKMKKHLRPSKKSSKIVRDQSITSNTTLRNRSVNTDDDTGDEFKPSSLVEGIGFKPVHNSSEHQYDSAPLSDVTPKADSKDEVETQFFNDHPNNSAPTLSYPSEDEKGEKLPPRKRNSIWSLLLRNRQTIHSTKLPPQIENLRSPTLSISTEHPTSDDDSVVTNSLQQNHTTNQVVLRNNGTQLNQIHRKRSLSAPTLPNLNLSDVNTQLSNLQTDSPVPSRKYFDTKGKENKFQTRGNESDNEPYMSRSKSAYVKRKKRPRVHSDSDPAKPKPSWSVRLKRVTKEFPSNLSLHEGSDNDSGRLQLGTTARKAKDKKVKSERNHKNDQKRRHRQKMLRRKHARERQLVYSSFAICIAFAICIMPTSLLYLYQVIMKASVQASIIMIVSCFAWLHSVINPVIYGYLNLQYRREYNKIFNSLKFKIVPKSEYIPSTTKSG